MTKSMVYIFGFLLVIQSFIWLFNGSHEHAVILASNAIILGYFAFGGESND